MGKQLVGAYDLHKALQAVSAYTGKGLKAFGGTFSGNTWTLTDDGYNELERVLQDAAERSTKKHVAITQAWESVQVSNQIAVSRAADSIERVRELEAYAKQVRAGLADLPARHRDMRDAIALGLLTDNDAMNSDD
ncbi:MAG TPA: hypothetical protein VFQ42_22530 [Mycobacterium sp.]|nr:hypothetical protein [Mycobacterium sp.]